MQVTSQRAFSYASVCKRFASSQHSKGVLVEKPVVRSAKPQLARSIEYIHTEDRVGVKEGLIASIRSAQESIEIFTYTFSSREIAKELNIKAREGVRIVIHIDSEQASNLKYLLSSKVAYVLHDCKKGIFHHKTMIVDQETIWTGSGNFTKAAHDHQFNLFEKIVSKTFAAKISQIFAQRRPKTYSVKEKVGNQRVEYWHMPATEGDLFSGKARQNSAALKRVKEVIKSAKKTLRVANANFTNKRLADSLIKAHKRGVSIEFVYNPDNLDASSGAILSKLKASGIKVIPINSSKEHHLKFMIADDKVMVNGSANWSSSSFSRNDESFTVVEYQTNTQKRQMQKFWRHITS